MSNATNCVNTPGSDENILLIPRTRFDLEQAIEFIDDELGEVTPKSIRLRKKEHERKRAGRVASGA